MFNDLPDNKAIKMGEVFIVKLPASYYNGFEINGVRVNGGLHTLPNLDNIYSVKPSLKRLTHYELNGEEIGVAIFNSKSPSSYYDDDYEEYQFDSLEHEYDVKKEWERIKDAVPIYKETPEQLLPVEIEVIGTMVDTGSKFISTPYQLGKAFFDSSGGIYNLDRYSIACDEVRQIRQEYPDAKVDLPTHSGLEYLKVNGTYIFTRAPEPWIKGSSFPTIVTSLDAAKEIERDTRKIVRSRMMVEIKPIVADSIMLKDIYKFLDRVEDSLSSIEVKQKSYHCKRALVNRLAEKMKELEQFVMDS